jgi:hypothetical protein
MTAFFLSLVERSETSHYTSLKPASGSPILCVASYRQHDWVVSMTAFFFVLLNEVKHLTMQVCSLQVAHLACVLLPIVSMTGW